MSGNLRSLVPGVIAPLLPSVFDRPKPDEPAATCDACAMCNKDEAGVPIPVPADAPFDYRGGAFHPDAKCCSFHPTLPNFYVGALLADTSPESEEGRRRMRKKIEERHGVTPYWVRPPRKTRVYLEASRIRAFGKSTKLLCPYYDGGRCSVWHFREAVCSTWYCKHDRGAAGRQFWMALKDWFMYMERQVSIWAVSQIDPTLGDDPVPRLKITLDDLEDRRPSDVEHQAIWRDWSGREEELYKECHARVAKLTPQEFVGIVQDKNANVLLSLLADAHDVITAPRLADKLIPAADLRRTKRENGESIVSYSTFDAQFVSDSLAALIDAIRPDERVDDFVARMRSERGWDVPRALLLRLQHFEILVPPDHERAPKPKPAAEPAKTT